MGIRPGPLLLTLTVLALALAAPPASAHAYEADHGHLTLVLGNEAETTEAEPADRLTHRIEAAVRSETDAEGDFVRLPMPARGSLVGFTVPGESGAVTIEGRDGSPWAVMRLSGVENGTLFANVTLVAVRTVDLDATIEALWEGLTIEHLTVYVETPQEYTVSSAGKLLPQSVHGGPAGRRAWNQFDYTGTTLDLSIRESFTGSDPALADPPSPVTGWVVLVAIAAVSGGAWVLGKKIEGGDEEG